jgi:alpha-aminoadipate carrier protein LysW
MSQIVECPFCEAPVAVEDDTVKDELLECSDCGAELVVTALVPLMVEEAPQVEEDWGQ